MCYRQHTKEHWNKHITTGAYYQLNTQSALTWAQAEASCKQQASSLLSITDPHQQAYLTALLGREGGGQGDKLWTGLIKSPEHGWHWSNGRPFRYLNWDSGHPLPNPGHDCGIVDPAVQYLWQSSTCTKKLGYICYSERAATPPTTETGFCSRPWIPYNGHCFHLNRAQKKWSDAQQVCRKEGGDLVSIRNVEDQSFVISQLGYASTDELWIGLNDKKTERLFDWIDHSAVTFTSWELGKPAVFSDAEDCVLIRGENGNWADRVCDEKHGFICMKMSASQPSGDEVEQDVGCKSGWKRHGSYCYFVGTATKTFDEAKNDCKTSDSYLADVSNGVDNAFLVSLVGLRPEKYFWLGLSNQNDIDQFVWTNANSVRFTHWNAEMPEPSESKRTWYDTRDYCRTIGGDLLSIHSGLELTFVKSVSGTVWIGLSAPDPVTGYVWSDGSPVNFLHWQDGEPNNKNNVESCAEFRTYRKHRSGSWSDVNCEKNNQWLCQIRTGATPKPPPDPVIPDYNKTSDGWLEWNGTQYYINNKKMAMEKARRFCQQRHGDLVTIDSEAERVFLWNQMSKSQSSYWIGLDVDLDGTYDWNEGQPDFKYHDENCATMGYSTGFWHNYNCGFEYGSICKRSGSPPANTTVAPTVAPKGGCPPHWKQLNHKTNGYFRYIDGWFLKFSHWGKNEPSRDRPCVYVDVDGKWKTADCKQIMNSVCMKSTGEWLWLDKTIMDYTYWDEDQPDDGSHGGISTTDGTWKTSDQRFRRPYICKTPQVLAPTTPTTLPHRDPPQHGHIALAVVMSIILIATGAVIAFLLYKKFAHRLSIRVNLNTFDNPLFFSREKSQTGVVDTEKLVENAEEDSPEPVVSV
ncbi:Macrophage mannose receptor 1 [Dissostichus eleginoides]|uniref:Macrophage mannose receptor 1 n=1 Tax=Dissostichus eleginoides TaxID=100907 RepID=A0AAD9EUT4_DISEL|nr:Macrophage mannose receptor 1 [Dissostichus eleginoides]